MRSPPKALDGFRVLEYARIDTAVRPTRSCRHFVKGSRMGPACALVICEAEDSEGYYLFYCDVEWNVLTDTWHRTVEDAKRQAAFEYDGIDEKWLSD
jgi:hypothetical protein